MADNNTITLSGKVTLIANSTTFKVQLENGIEVTATLSGKMKMHHIQIIRGDIVTVELSTYDLTKGRIVFRK
jgi:translation initiation factor IF-1